MQELLIYSTVKPENRNCNGKIKQHTHLKKKKYCKRHHLETENRLHIRTALHGCSCRGAFLYKQQHYQWSCVHS